MLTNKRRMKFLAVSTTLSLVVSALVYVRISNPRSRQQMARAFAEKIDTPVTTNLLVGTDRSGNSSEFIRIMYANNYFASREWGFGSGSTPLDACPHLIGRCEFTRNVSLMNESHALLFHMRNGFTWPAVRLLHQKWIFAIRESPVHTHKNLNRFQNVFNLTMSYVRSVENNIDWSYGRCLSTTGDHSRFQWAGDFDAPSDGNADVNYAFGKKHLVAWFVSKCNATSWREKYVYEMQKYADIHIYGCGPYKCPKSKRNFCYKELLNNDYKFYLSFENSFCKDYITHKLWRAMAINIVPVVLGHANYSQLLPPHSHIDVRDFASPRLLVDYLKLLSANDTLYNEYFRWKTRYRCGSTNPNIACELCRQLLDARGRQQRVDDVVSFWGSKKNCIGSRTFYSALGVDTDAWEADIKEARAKRKAKRQREKAKRKAQRLKDKREGPK